jgi:predicted lipid carrier protein YhbT
MINATLSFPQPLARLIRQLPTLPPSFIFTQILNLALQEIIRRRDLKALYEKKIAISITDVGLCLHFTVLPDGFSHVTFNGTPDLLISATMHDFYLLATRKEDPDTLFFKRRLVVEGNTELGLVAKNTLDGIEFYDASMLTPRNLLALAKNSLHRVFG